MVISVVTNVVVTIVGGHNSLWSQMSSSQLSVVTTLCGHKYRRHNSRWSQLSVVTNVAVTTVGGQNSLWSKMSSSQLSVVTNVVGTTVGDYKWRRYNYPCGHNFLLSQLSSAQNILWITINDINMNKMRRQSIF